MPFTRAALVSEIPAGAIREIQVSGKAVALANVQGKFYAINSVCLHRGGPIGQGELHGTVVTCPWHGWDYDVTSGKVVQNPNMAVPCYTTEVRGDEVYVDAG